MLKKQKGNFLDSNWIKLLEETTNRREEINTQTSNIRLGGLSVRFWIFFLVIIATAVKNGRDKWQGKNQRELGPVHYYYGEKTMSDWKKTEPKESPGPLSGKLNDWSKIFLTSTCCGSCKTIFKNNGKHCILSTNYSNSNVDQCQWYITLRKCLIVYFLKREKLVGVCFFKKFTGQDKLRIDFGFNKTFTETSHF